MIFSVVIPTFNRKDKILECLASLYAQTYPRDKFEIIVVDDCSTDGTYQRLSSEKIGLFRLKKHLGRSAARNFGVIKSTGKYVAFTDSDCVVPSNWLERLEKGFKRFPNVVGVGGGITNESPSIFGYFERKTYSRYIRSDRDYVSTSINEMPFALGNMAYLKTAFISAGGFNEKIPDFCSAEDADIKSRLLTSGRSVVFVPVFVTHNHSFGLTNFYNQSMERGCGMLLDSKRKGKIQKRVSIYLKILATPIYFLRTLANSKLDFRFTIVETLFFVFRNIGKLKYYDLISKLRL